MVNTDAALELPLDLGHDSVPLRQATPHQLRLAALLADGAGDDRLAWLARTLAAELPDDSHVSDVHPDRFAQLLDELNTHH